MITKEELNELVIQYKAEMLIGDPLVAALEDFRDIWDGLEKAVEEIIEKSNSHFMKDEIHEAFLVNDSARVLKKHLPFLKDN